MAFWNEARSQWVVTWTVGGKRRKKHFPVGATKRLAEDFEMKLRLGLIHRDLGRDRVMFGPYAERWLKVYPTIKARTDSTAHKDRQIVTDYLIPYFGDKGVADITTADCLAFQASLWRGGLGMKAQSIWNVMSRLRLVFRLAILEGETKNNPAVHVPRVPKASSVPNFWTPTEADAVLMYAREHNYGAFQVMAFALNTGLRPGELRGLKRDCLSFREGFVDVRRNWCTKTNRLLEYTKTKNNRRVPLSDAILAVLSEKEALAMDSFVFPGLSNSWGFRVMQPLAVAAKVKPIRMHDLRHTFASHLVMHGKHPVEIKELLGHRKLASTDIYMHLVDKLRRGATDCLVTGQAWTKPAHTTNVHPIRPASH